MRKNEKSNSNKSYLLGSFFVKKNNKLFNVKINDILYIHSEGNYCTIIAKQKFDIKKSLTQVLVQLPSGQFVRIHQRFIVQIKHIFQIDIRTNQVYVEEVILPIGRKYKAEVMNQIRKV